MNRIIWLASYPKSGNTWFRVFLTNLLRKSNEPANINELDSTTIASSRMLFDELSAIPSSDLTAAEIENLRPYIYDEESHEAKCDIFHKIHDALTFTSEGRLLVSEKATKAAIYFIRNPLDVAVSFAHHSSKSFDNIIKEMNQSDFAFSTKPDKLHNQLAQRLLTWSEHVKSWTEQNYFPVKVIRYEDMKKDTFITFKSAIKFLNIECTDDEIKKAIAFSDFTELQKQESKKGFKEKTPQSESFFRKGKIDSWKEELSNIQINTIIKHHREVMGKYGYLF